MVSVESDGLTAPSLNEYSEVKTWTWRDSSMSTSGRMEMMTGAYWVSVLLRRHEGPCSQAEHAHGVFDVVLFAKDRSCRSQVFADGSRGSGGR